MQTKKNKKIEQNNENKKKIEIYKNKKNKTPAGCANFLRGSKKKTKINKKQAKKIVLKF